MYFKSLINLKSIRNISGFIVRNYRTKVFYSNVKKSDKINLLRLVNNHDFAIWDLYYQQVCYAMTSSNPSVKRKRNYTNYFISFTFGSIIGTLTGLWHLKEHETFESTTEIVSNKSILDDFGTNLNFHLYQYETCPYCSQIRAYLDYFGFNYKLTEVDSYKKEEIKNFTRARSLPIIVIENKVNKKRWYLGNATVILSALESIRNDKQINFSQILDQYLPVLKGNTIHSTINPLKYHVSNSDLNSIEWRKWINNKAIPAFKFNAVSSTKDMFETIDNYSTKSRWAQLFYISKAYVNEILSLFQSLRFEYIKFLISTRDQNKTSRENLHSVIKEWENGLNGKNFISGTNKPNLADISMYGSIRAFEGSALFRESISQHSTFKEWYERMQKIVFKGHGDYHDEKKDRRFFKLHSVEELLDAQLTKTNEPVFDANEKLKTENENYPDNITKNLPFFRILTINYLIHILAFSYASWMAK